MKIDIKTELFALIAVLAFIKLAYSLVVKHTFVWLVIAIFMIAVIGAGLDYTKYK